MKRPGYLVAAIVTCTAMACTGSVAASRKATAQALSTLIHETSTAQGLTGIDAAPSVAPNIAVETARAKATVQSEAMALTQTAESFQSTESISITETAIAPIVAQLPTYGIQPGVGRPGWIHPPITISVEGHLAYDYTNYYIGMLMSDFVISADITWNTTTGLSGCGFALRSDGNQEAPNQYLSIITRGDGGSVAFINQKDGSYLYTELERATFHDPSFQFQNDTTNRLTVAANGDTITFYTNDTRIRSFTATDYDRGFVAMGAVSETGQTTCKFDNTWLWILD